MRMKMAREELKNRRGLTLVELMISLLIFGIVIGVVFSFLVGSRNSYNDTRQRAQYQQSVRAVLSLVTREIRSAGCDPTESGFEIIAAAAAGQLRCQSDLNGDADTGDLGPDESVTYTFNAAAGELSRDNGTGAVVILRGLTAWTFTYYAADGTVLAAMPLSALDRARVREVEVDLAGETAEGEPVSYGTRIALRNG